MVRIRGSNKSAGAQRHGLSAAEWRRFEPLMPSRALTHGFGSKLHGRCDRRRQPMAFVLTPGEWNERAALPELMAPARHRGHHPAAPDGEAAEARGLEPLPRKNVAERLVGRLKEYHRVATRYDKLAASCLAFVQLAAVRLWL